jgi:DNA transposition AAA+ family ATPase
MSKNENDDLERIDKIENLQLMYPRLQEILKKMNDCLNSRVSPEPRSMLVTGFPGVGKTKMYERFLHNYPRREEADATIVPVLSTIIPSRASVKGLVTKLLYTLGDPMADRGTEVQQTIRLQHLLQAAKTELIILDEFQHFIDRDSYKVLQSSSDWLKNLLNETGIPLVLIGMPSCKLVLDANPQLKRRFSVQNELKPFEWSNQSAKNEVRPMLAIIEKMLPLKKPSHLSDPDTAYRIYCATAGVMGSIMKLVRGAAKMAIESGVEQITLENLDQVYEVELASNAPEYPSPFEQNKKTIEPLALERLMGQYMFENKSRRRKRLYA